MHLGKVSNRLKTHAIIDVVSRGSEIAEKVGAIRLGALKIQRALKGNGLKL